jgi:uncharacterized membrane protein YfhO
VQIARHEPNWVELKVVQERAGLLVLTDPYYPGWQAAIDGQAAPIHRVNHDLRGVFVPAGTHTVVFSYRPLSVLIGAILATASLIAVMAVMIAERRK